MNEQNEVFYSEQELVKAGYTCAFHVLLSENKMIPLYMDSYMSHTYGMRITHNPDFRQVMLSIVLSEVDKNHQELLIQTLLPERFRAIMSVQKELSMHFRINKKNIHKNHCVVLKRMDESLDKVFIGVKEEEADNEQERFQVGSENILLVQDDNRLKILLGDRFPAILAADEIQAEEILYQQRSEIAAVITGIGMPEEQIHKLLKLVGDTIPVIISVDKSEEKAERFLHQGGYDILRFPCSADILQKRIAHLIELRNVSAIMQEIEIDPQIGMYSREFFYRKAEESLNYEREKELELICFSIENYPIILEKFGNAVGSLVLQHVSNRIRELVPDTVVCGRLSEDEIVLLRQKKSDVPYQEFEEKIRMGAPLPNLVIKIGYVKSDGHTNINKLLGQARSAISKIRQQFGIYTSEYNDAMRMEDLKEQRILSSMENALENHQYQIYYQPKHNSNNGKIGGGEALIRWMHPEYGFMNPGEFIPLFERVGFIRGLDRYVCVQVCKDIKRWQAQGLEVVPISINLSRRDFETGDLADWIINLTDQMHIDRSLLHLEVTESAFTETPDLIISCLRKLHQSGFVIELDDFGSGYSSLTMLNRIDVSVLKIDQSIIAQEDANSENSVLKFCMQLAKLMKLTTVVEGVETKEQAELVKSLGGDLIQGYYYSRPMPVQEFEKCLKYN